MKQVWVPKTETKVTVDQSGNVHVWDEIKMELKPVSRPVGFGDKK